MSSINSHDDGYTNVDECTPPGRCIERPTALFLDACSWKLTYSELMTHDPTNDHSNVILVSCLYVRTHNYYCSVFVIGPPYWCVIPPHVCYQHYSYILRTGRCLRFTKLCWVGKHVNISMKPTNSPTQGQSNPRKNRSRVAFGPLFPTANTFSWVGIGFI